MQSKPRPVSNDEVCSPPPLPNECALPCSGREGEEGKEGGEGKEEGKGREEEEEREVGEGKVEEEGSIRQ